MQLSTKIRGMILGAAIGDALGAPVESLSADEIKKRYPSTQGTGITDYIQRMQDNGKPSRLKPGYWTDDTQLTLAVAQGCINSKSFSVNDFMQSQSLAHVQSYKDIGTGGWGRTTRTAIATLSGTIESTKNAWLTSAPREKNLGLGNGVCMKVSPVAAIAAAQNTRRISSKIRRLNVEELVIPLTLMTHYSSIAVSSALAQYSAALYCLTRKNAASFKPNEFAAEVIASSAKGLKYVPETLVDNMTSRLSLLTDVSAFNTNRIIKEFNGGTVYCYNSLPFSLMFFLKDPYSINSMFDCASAGGDTDSNASMVGSLLGALHGEEFFKPFSYLVDNLDSNKYILGVADKLCKRLKI